MRTDNVPCATDSEPVLVLLHGAGLGPWIWESLRWQIPFQSVALDVPSRHPGTSPAKCAQDLLADPAFPVSGPVVLVLHSLAGVLETPLAAALGPRLAQVIHLAAVVPEPGRSFAAAMGFPARIALPLLFWLRPGGLMPTPAMLKDQLGGDLTDEQLARLRERHLPEFPGLFVEPVPQVPISPRRTYVVCTRDRSVPPALQRNMAERIEARQSELDCGHLPMLSHVDALAKLLVDALRAQAPASVRTKAA